MRPPPRCAGNCVIAALSGTCFTGIGLSSVSPRTPKSSCDLAVFRDGRPEWEELAVPGELLLSERKNCVEQPIKVSLRLGDELSGLAAASPERGQ